MWLRVLISYGWILKSAVAALNGGCMLGLLCGGSVFNSSSDWLHSFPLWPEIYQRSCFSACSLAFGAVGSIPGFSLQLKLAFPYFMISSPLAWRILLGLVCSLFVWELASIADFIDFSWEWFLCFLCCFCFHCKWFLFLPLLFPSLCCLDYCCLIFYWRWEFRFLTCYFVIFTSALVLWIFLSALV